jgi:hypothetical protein
MNPAHWENSKLYQIKKFLFNSQNATKDIIIVIPICSQTTADKVACSKDFCQQILDCLPEENGEYIGSRVCSYSYFQNSPTSVKTWSTNKREVKEGLGSKFILKTIS